MSTGIQWTDETWNPVVGCTHISPGCDHCYAATIASRQMSPAHAGLTVGRKWNDTVRLLPERLDEPARWRKPRRVFVGSMTDIFHTDVPDEFIGSVWDRMACADRHVFQCLTKRPQRMRRLLCAWETAGAMWRRHDLLWCGPTMWPLQNVWLGTSIESQAYAWRARHLSLTPAAVRFLSVEPLLGPIDLELPEMFGSIHWVIVGCESGPGRRPCHVEWIRGLRDQCVAAGVPLFVKQLQAEAPTYTAGRVLHNLEDFPDDLRIREWPVKQETP